MGFIRYDKKGKSDEKLDSRCEIFCSMLEMDFGLCFVFVDCRYVWLRTL